MSTVGLVLAHGRGGSSGDMLGLHRAARLGNVSVIAPDAPGQSWWPQSFLAPSALMAPPLGRALEVMAQSVAALELEGIARHNIWLGGFSQGACLALEAFARLGEGLAGVFAFSGGLIGSSDAAADTASAALYGYQDKLFDYAGRRDGAKVWLSVHERDPHIPLVRAQRSLEVLAAMGAKTEFGLWPGAGHGMQARDLEVMRDWTRG